MTRQAPTRFPTADQHGVLLCSENLGTLGVLLDKPDEMAHRHLRNPASTPSPKAAQSPYRNEYDRSCQSSASSGQLHEMGSPFDGRKFFPELRSSNAEASDA